MTQSVSTRSALDGSYHTQIPQMASISPNVGVRSSLRVQQTFVHLSTPQMSVTPNVVQSQAFLDRDHVHTPQSTPQVAMTPNVVSPSPNQFFYSRHISIQNADDDVFDSENDLFQEGTEARVSSHGRGCKYCTKSFS